MTAVIASLSASLSAVGPPSSAGASGADGLATLITALVWLKAHGLYGASHALTLDLLRTRALAAAAIWSAVGVFVVGALLLIAPDIHP